MKQLLAIFCMLALVGCGEESKIKDAVRAHLNDPGSAEFKDVFISANGERACIVWNAKNKMGGYGDWKMSELTKKTSAWEIEKMNGSKRNCSEVGVKALDAEKQARKEAKERAIVMMQKLRNISRIEAEESCPRLVLLYQIHAGSDANDRARGETSSYGEQQRKIEAAFADQFCVIEH